MDLSFLLPLSSSNDQEDGRHGPWTHVYFLNNCILKARTSQSFFFVSLFPFSLFLIFQEYGIWGRGTITRKSNNLNHKYCLNCLKIVPFSLNVNLPGGKPQVSLFCKRHKKKFSYSVSAKQLVTILLLE